MNILWWFTMIYRNPFLFLRATTSYLSSHGGSPGSPAQLPVEYAAVDTSFNAGAV